MFFTDRIKLIVVADSDLIFSCKGRCPGVNLRDIQDNPKCKLANFVRMLDLNTHLEISRQPVKRRVTHKGPRKPSSKKPN
jgi:hypothetical protein